MCVDCFQASDHEGHEVLFSQSHAFSTTCDCGDATAWRKDRPLGCGYHPPAPPDQLPIERTREYLTDYSNIPAALQQSAYQAFVIVLDYIITTLQFSPQTSDFGKLPKDEAEMLQPEKVTGLPKTIRSPGPWSVIIWGDDRHTTREVTRQIRDAVGVTWEVAEGWAREVEEVVSQFLCSS